MKKTHNVGTSVSFDNVPGEIVGNRRTVPDLKARYDYIVRIDFGDGPVEWGFAASELDLFDGRVKQ